MIISEFLQKYLHDPHWREVILLLLGKLKRKPVTAQLRQILEGNIKSCRSRYTDVVQQDLFFVCACLAEEIAVENELAEFVVSRLSSLIKTSPIQSQRTDALESLASLRRTRQYASLALRELIALVTQDIMVDIYTRIEAAQLLHWSSHALSEERHQAIQLLLHLAQRPDLSFRQTIQAAQALYQHSPKESAEKQQAVQLLLHLAQRPGLSFGQTLRAAQTLYRNSPEESAEKQQALQLLLHLAQLPDLSTDRAVQAAQTLYRNSSKGSAEKQQALQLLLHLAQLPDLAFEQTMLVARTFYKYSPIKSGESRRTADILWQLAQKQSFTVDQRLQVATVALTVEDTNAPVRAQAVRIVLNLVQGEKARQYLQERWRPILGKKAEASDIPSIVELAQQELLPTKAHDQMYQILRNMVPQFDKIDSLNDQLTP